MTQSVKALLTAILLTAETQTTEELARKALSMMDEPPSARDLELSKLADEALSPEFNKVMNYLKEYNLLRPGTFSENVIYALGRVVASSEAEQPNGPDVATSPGPVNCNIRIQHQPGRNAYPRTCDRCEFGPCPFFNDDGTYKTPPVALAC